MIWLDYTVNVSGLNIPFHIRSGANKLTLKTSLQGGAMARPVETQMTISCLQCEWSVEATNTSVQASIAFLEAAHSHVDQHEQHALEVVQRLRLYSENYVEPTQPPSQDAPPSPDTGIQTGFMDKTRNLE